jgi:bifunctional oligoribonuclease and PAP phosphatase NrnA
MIVLGEYHTAIIHLSKEDLAAFRFQIGDTEGIVNYPLSMKKINLAVLITEKKDLVRLSFRSKGTFSVNDLARKHFNGGGHDNAAGGNSGLGLKETITQLLGILPLYKEMLTY